MQKSGFLNRYDFAYADRDTVNTAFTTLEKYAPILKIQRET